MAYRLKPGKLHAKAVRKIAREQISRALAALSKNELSPADVHEGRKVVKRLRSLLKLIEPALAPRDFAKLYKSIGRAGDLLAGARDRHVMQQTILRLEARFGAEAKEALLPLRLALESEQHQQPEHIDPVAVMRARKAFANEGRKLDKLRVKGNGLEVFSAGLEATYKTARRNCSRAYAKPHDERFHDFRKAVQWHWRHMALVSRAWPHYFAVRITACQALADALGDDHDLSVLLAASAKLYRDKKAARAPERLARQRQDELRQEARALAERLFAEQPKAFRQRMETYWSAKTPLSAAETGPSALGDV